MPTLNLRVRHGDGEPAYALFRRLAARNAIASVRDFGELTGLHYGNILRGRELERLADLNGSSIDDLRRWTPTKVENFWTLNGHRLSRGSWRPERAAYCAECLISCIGRIPEGVTSRHAALLRGAHRRAWWDLAFIDCCPIHRSLLVRVCNCGRRITASDALARRCPGGCDRISMSGKEISAELTLPDAYLMGRLGTLPTQPSVPLLDDLPIDLAAAVMEQIGSAVFSVHHSTGHLMGAYRCEVRLAGLRFLQNATANGRVEGNIPAHVSQRIEAWMRNKRMPPSLARLRYSLVPLKPPHVPRRAVGRYELKEAAARAGVGVSAFLTICVIDKIAPVQAGRWSDEQIGLIRHLAQPELLMPLPGGGYVPDRDLKPYRGQHLGAVRGVRHHN